MALYQRKRNMGISILGILFLGVIAIFVLSYFKIDIKSVVESPQAQNNVGYVTGSSQNVWDKYLKQPASYIWNDVIVNLLWQSFIDNLQRVKNGQPTSIEQNAPALPK